MGALALLGIGLVMVGVVGVVVWFTWRSITLDRHSPPPLQEEV